MFDCTWPASNVRSLYRKRNRTPSLLIPSWLKISETNCSRPFWSSARSSSKPQPSSLSLEHVCTYCAARLSSTCIIKEQKICVLVTSDIDKPTSCVSHIVVSCTSHWLTTTVASHSIVWVDGILHCWSAALGVCFVGKRIRWLAVPIQVFNADATALFPGISTSLASTWRLSTSCKNVSNFVLRNAVALIAKLLVEDHCLVFKAYGIRHTLLGPLSPVSSNYLQLSAPIPLHVQMTSWCFEFVAPVVEPPFACPSRMAITQHLYKSSLERRYRLEQTDKKWDCHFLLSLNPS